MQLQLLQFTLETTITLSPTRITFTSHADECTSHFTVPTAALLIMDIITEQEHKYRGLTSLNKTISLGTGARFEFDDIGMMAVKLRIDKGDAGVELVEYYFYSSIDDE